jgi:hypothetical protein
VCVHVRPRKFEQRVCQNCVRYEPDHMVESIAGICRGECSSTTLIRLNAKKAH